MISFPNCKINLGLYITAKRADGYHDLETVFFPVPLTDVLEFVPAQEMAFSSTGLAVDTAPEQNLCARAYQLLKSRFPTLPPIHIHLHKIIPMGAGLGGGSADAAFMLQMLNTYFNLGLSQEELSRLALTLGSDCPFFIYNKPAYAMGRGEILEPVALDLKGMFLTLINPGIHISTGEAFRGIQPRDPGFSLKTRVCEPMDTWKDWLSNDFESTVFLLHPQIADIKKACYAAGAVFASMTGSGSTVYGLFREEPSLSFPGTFMVRTVRIK